MIKSICKLCQHEKVCKYRDEFDAFVARMESNLGEIPEWVTVSIVATCDHYASGENVK